MPSRHCLQVTKGRGKDMQLPIACFMCWCGVTLVLFWRLWSVGGPTYPF